MIITSFFLSFGWKKGNGRKLHKLETARRFVQDGGKDSLLYITASMHAFSRKVDC
jgi:hypothetical protein